MDESFSTLRTIVWYIQFCISTFIENYVSRKQRPLSSDTTQRICSTKGTLGMYVLKCLVSIFYLYHTQGLKSSTFFDTSHRQNVFRFFFKKQPLCFHNRRVHGPMHISQDVVPINLHTMGNTQSKTI